jgi:hypothetical protein
MQVESQKHAADSALTRSCEFSEYSQMRVDSLAIASCPDFFHNSILFKLFSVAWFSNPTQSIFDPNIDKEKRKIMH